MTPSLAAHLLRRCHLGEVTVRLGGQSFTILGAERAEDLGHAESCPDELPFWAEVWAAGYALAEYLLEGPALSGPVLELGCGLGLVGIAAALRGARVVQTDAAVDAVRAAIVNSERCGILDQMRHVAADWRAWPLRGRFSLVLGGEITYRSETHAALFQVLRGATLPGATVLLADAARPAGDRFARRLMSAGWRVTEYPLVIPSRAAGPGRLLRAQAP